SGTFDLRYSKNNGSTWTPIISGLPGSFRHHSWSMPIAVSDQVLVEVSRNGISDVNDTVFTILQRPGNLHITSACPDSIMLAWSPVSGATGYNISMLANKYMDYVGTT